MRRAAPSLAALALVGAACRAQAPAPRAPDLIRIAYETDVLSIDPTDFADSVTHSVLANAYEGLVTFDANMNLAPALAVSWNNLDDTTWLIELRPDVRFHDGAALTAAAVKAALENARDRPGSGMRVHLANLAAIEAEGPLRLRLLTSRRDPLLVSRLAYVLIARDAGGPGAPRLVGTGPYRITRWERGRLLEAEANPTYWGGRPGIAQAMFVPVEQGDALERLRRGDVDLLRYLPPEQVAQAQALPGLRVVSREGLTTYFLWLHCLGQAGPAAHPFADRRVRQAVSLALDRNEIVRRMGGSAVPAHQLVTQGIFGHVANRPALPYDPPAARALLAQAGFAHGFETTLTNRRDAGPGVDAVREMLAAVGIRATIERLPWSDVVERWGAQRLALLYAGWRFENGDAYSFFVDCLATRDPQSDPRGCNPGFSSPRLDRLIAEHADIVSQADRLKHYEDLMSVALEEMPLVPVYTRINLFAVSDRLQWKPRLDGRLLAAEVSLKSP